MRTLAPLPVREPACTGPDRFLRRSIDLCRISAAMCRRALNPS